METSTNIATATEELDSPVMLSTQTFRFSALKRWIVFLLPILMAITYILAFFRASTVNSTKVYLIISTIYETTVLALMLFGKWKIKSQFHESFIKDLLVPSSGYQTTLLCFTSGAVAFQTFGEIAGLKKANNFFCFYIVPY